jgi:hypothetical protein
MFTTATLLAYTEAGTSVFARSKICHSRKSQIISWMRGFPVLEEPFVSASSLYRIYVYGTIRTYYTAQVEPVILLSLRVMFAYFKVTSV